MARRRNSQRGSDEIRVTTGQAAHAMMTELSQYPDPVFRVPWRPVPDHGVLRVVPARNVKGVPSEIISVGWRSS
jgi:hypothetical protein